MDSQAIFPSNIWKDIAINVNKNNQTDFKKEVEEERQYKEQMKTWNFKNCKSFPQNNKNMYVCKSTTGSHAEEKFREQERDENVTRNENVTGNENVT